MTLEQRKILKAFGITLIVACPWGIGIVTIAVWIMKNLSNF